jgi:GNAT superfamily N-acetyltransferase
MVAEQTITYRRAAAADIAALARHHRKMFEEMRTGGDRENCCSPTDSCCAPQAVPAGFPSDAAKNHTPAPDFDRLEKAQQQKLDKQLPAGTCMAWLAEYRGEPVASGCITVIDTVPLPEDPCLETAFLHSVYTEPDMRGKGIASAILDRLLDECRQRRITRVQLNASRAGRGVYRSKGFQPLERAMILWL